MEEKKVLGIIAIILGGFGLLLSWIPIINNFAFVLALVGLVLGIIALIYNRKNKKLISLIGTVISVVTILVVIGTQSVYLKAIDNATGKQKASMSTKSNSNKKQSKQKISKVLNTPILVDDGKLEITITRYKVIPVGQSGNQYGKSPVIAFWYNIKNINKNNIDPTGAWFSSSAIKVVQDNNGNQVNTLEVDALPDDKFLQTQTQQIKIGGTAQNAVAYTLSDQNTPVKITFEKNMINSDPVAEETFNIK